MNAIYLSRLVLDPSVRAVAMDLADCHALHRRVMSAFKSSLDHSAARDHFEVLHRLELRGGAPPTLHVQSNQPPEWQCIPDRYLLHEPDNPECKDVGPKYSCIEVGTRMRFRLRANPTRKIDTKSIDGKRRNGRRVELTGDEARLSWLARKAGDAGFELLRVTAEAGDYAARVDPAAKTFGRRGGHTLTFSAVVFEGLLRVHDVARFHAALVGGIGPAKAFGFGLLSIAGV
jgi:CRISPR system Cascade subunit CasE